MVVEDVCPADVLLTVLIGVRIDGAREPFVLVELFVGESAHLRDERSETAEPQFDTLLSQPVRSSLLIEGRHPFPAFDEALFLVSLPSLSLMVDESIHISCNTEADGTAVRTCWFVQRET